MSPTAIQSSHSARDKVLATALALFTEKGYFNTSMRDITRASQVSTGSVYHWFADKEGIAAALYQDLVARMDGALDEIEAQHASAHDRCRAVLALLFRITAEEPAVMTFMLYVKHREFLPSQAPICSSRPFQRMRDMVGRGMARGEIRDGDLLATAACLFGGGIRMVTLALDGILERPLASYLDEVWDNSWRAVRAD
jgi:AcrR family transcriptional regulator